MPFEIDKPGRLQGDDEARGRLRHQHRELPPVAALLPPDRRRTGRGQEQRREVILAAKASCLCHQRQYLAAMAGSETEGAQAGVERALGP
jgi:hypothetical protein